MNLCGLIQLLRSDLIRMSDPLLKNENGKIKIVNVFNPRFFPVFLIRLSRYCYLKKWLSPLSFFLMWINFVLFGIEVTPKCSIGHGFLLPHTSGTVIGAAEIGVDVTIFQGVTLGAITLDMDFNLKTRPTIQSGVVVGAGAKVLGGITVGQHSKIGANSVVLVSVPPNSTVVGVPGKVVTADV